MMKRIVGAGLAIILVVCFFVGCQGAGSQVDKSVNVESVVQEFKDAGLPIVYHIVYTDKNDPNGPGEKEYTEKGNFVDKRIELEYSETEPISATIEIFESESALKERADYLIGFSALDDKEYQIIKDNVLVRLYNGFTEEQVEEYADAIDGTIYNSPDTETHQIYYSYALFARHALQLEEGMDYSEAVEIMGFEPDGADTTCIWFDDWTPSMVLADIENEKLVNIEFYDGEKTYRDGEIYYPEDDIGDTGNSFAEESSSASESIEPEAVDEYTYGDEVFHRGFAIVFSEDYYFDVVDNQFSDKNGAEVVVFPVTITNYSGETGQVNPFSVTIFGSKGTESPGIDAYFDMDLISVGDLRDGATCEAEFYAIYDGDGDYYVEFDTPGLDAIEVRLPVVKE